MARLNYLTNNNKEQAASPAKEKGHNGFHNRLRGIGKYTYVIRLIAAHLFVLILVSYHSYFDSFQEFEYIIMGALLLYPHLSLLVYKYYQSSKQVEFRSLLMDCVLSGLVAYSINLALFPSIIVITISMVSALLVNGMWHFLRGAVAVVIAILLPSLLLGFEFSTDSPISVDIISGILIFSHFSLAAYTSYNRTILLKEAKVAIRKQKEELAWEKQKSDELLLNILPSETAAELKQYGKANPKSYNNVTVLFADFQEFTNIAERLTPSELVHEIDFCFKEFDRIIEKYSIEKIKTIGDAYLCVSGLPSPNANHALEITKAALEIQEFLDNLKQTRIEEGRLYFEARIGIHTGPVVAGIVGIKKFAYDIWGDTVNIAARMEQNSEVGKINISKQSYEHIRDYFNCVSRGMIEVKNKGQIEMFYVEETNERFQNKMRQSKGNGQAAFKKAKEHILQMLGNHLPRDLSYHGIHHTLDVYHAVQEIAQEEGIEGEDLSLLKTAALLHDAGFIKTYSGHEQASCLIARDILPGFNFSDEQIDKICGMIMATKLPQSPKNKLEEILCDADLDYLGRDDFYEIGKTLYTEFLQHNIIKDENHWHHLQLQFLKDHEYFTETCKQKRAKQKAAYIRELEDQAPISAE